MVANKFLFDLYNCCRNVNMCVTDKVNYVLIKNMTSSLVFKLTVVLFCHDVVTAKCHPGDKSFFSSLELYSNLTPVSDFTTEVVTLQNANILDYPEPPFNLSVQLRALKIKNSIQIFVNITWNATQDNRRKHYELIVVALSSRCEELFHTYNRFLSPNTTYIMLKSSPNQRIQFNCSYNISLSSVPPNPALVTSSRFTIHKLLKVNECIDDMCPQCTKSSLSKPENITFKSEEVVVNGNMSVTVRWSYTRNNNSNVILFQVSIFKQILSSEGAIMFQRQETKNISYTVYSSVYEARFVVSTPENYVFEVTVLDELRCHKSANKSLKVVFGGLIHNPDYTNSPVSLTLAVAGGFALTFLLSCFIWRKWWKPFRQTQRNLASGFALDYYRGTYSNSSIFTRDTHLNGEQQQQQQQQQGFSVVSQHFNVNYVEKEIQEARDLGFADLYEIHHGRLMLGREIGKGAFGRVCVARAESIVGISGQIVVAVKYLKDCPNEQETKDFLAEILMMKKVSHHPNVVSMLACCTLQEPFCMVMEYLAFGDLLNYLRKLRTEYERANGVFIGLSSSCCNVCYSNSDLHRQSPITVLNEVDVHKRSSDDDRLQIPLVERRYTSNSSLKTKHELICDDVSSEMTEETRLSTSGCGSDLTVPNTEMQLEVSLDSAELQSFAMQISNGMKHLANKGIVHRDLAARNILIGNDRTLKISDFGLSRSGVYVTQRGGRVPLRWLSIEAIRDNLYSSQSDVWAFGVVLWEICTLGGYPYATLSDKDLIHNLVNCHRLEKPVNCSDELYEVMQSCWHYDPQMRPNFVELCATLEKMTDEPHTYVNLDFIENIQLPPIKTTVDHIDDEPVT